MKAIVTLKGGEEVLIDNAIGAKLVCDDWQGGNMYFYVEDDLQGVPHQSSDYERNRKTGEIRRKT